MFVDQLEDAFRLDLPQADMGRGCRRYRPRQSPAGTMEHGQRPQVPRPVVDLEGLHVGQAGNVRAAMAVHDALGIAGRAGRVKQADRIPFVARARRDKVGVAAVEDRLILFRSYGGQCGLLRVGDVDHRRRRIHRLEPRCDGFGKPSVSKEGLCLTMLKTKGDRAGIQTEVDRVQHRAEHGDGEMRLKQSRGVGGEDRDRVAIADTAFAQG